MSILIKNNQTGIIREYGTNEHDCLHIGYNGSYLYYEHLQNGHDSLGGGYSFVMEDGKIPKESEAADAIRGMRYFNIGGFKAESKEHNKGKWLDIYATHIAYECSNCHMQMPILDYFNFCPNCGAAMSEVSK